jgi:bifunctional ADP-heptose synthase (sugar kinase/adenylyltransferase)
MGDPILDQYVHCDALGVASEAPVLGVTPIREDWYLGAAGLIAAQVLELGAHATLLTSYSAQDGGRLEEAAAAYDLPVINIDEGARPVVVKTRYLVDETKVFKVDGKRPPPLSTGASRALAARLRECIEDFDAVIVTDFGYGLFNASLIEEISRITRTAGKPYYLDVSHTRRANILQFDRPRLATPTEQELRFAFADNESGLSNLASRFFTQTSAEYLMLTMGKRGVLLFDKLRKVGVPLATDFLPALEAVAIDPVGAGDVFLAGACLADLCGVPFPHGAYFGELLASMHIARLGNSVVECSALHRYVDERPELATSDESSD